MIWAVLLFLGVPLWLCVLGLGTVVLRSHRLRSRHGNIPVRVLRPGHTRWTRGHAVWVSDVFAWRGSPAAWAEALMQVTALHDRPATPAEMAKLHRLGDDLAVVEMSDPDGETLTVVTTRTFSAVLMGPFLRPRAPVAAPPGDDG